MKRFVILFLLFLFFSCGFAQQKKYALLIGINQYQIKDSKGNIVLDPKNGLLGCVNDAESLKALLINKFKFPASNIVTLYNKEASSANILKQIDILNSKCKNGDVAVVYYSGHGMPFRFGKGNDDIAEVILPSDAFATNPFSYIQQAELAIKFNLFVDKDVTLTTIFDCCFSLATSSRGNLMIPGSLSITDTLNTNISDDDNWTEPLPIAPEDADEYELLPNDSILNEEISIATQPLEVLKNRGLSEKQYQDMTKNVLPFGFTKANTTYNPPSQREGSQFIFMSATNDMQTAPEVRDENGIKRGAFTLALTKVIESQPATVSFKEIFNKTVSQLKSSGTEITPSSRYKPNQRENKNLFGIAPEELKLKVYLPSELYRYNDLSALFKKWVQPLNTNEYKSQEFKKNNPSCSKIYITNNGKNVLYIDGKTKKSKTISSINELKKIVKGQSYFIYLPIPKSLSDSIKKECLKNKKIELVNDISKADVSFYCTNYSEKSSLFSDVIDIGKKITDDFINYEYIEKLSFVGGTETAGLNRNKPGHTYSSKEDVVIAAAEKPGIIIKKIMQWLNTKTAK